MARSAVTVANPKFQVAATVTADAMDKANGHSIDVSEISDERFVIRLAGSTTAGTVTFKAGDFPASAIGDLDVSLGATDIKTIILETTRFKDNDGLILIDIDSTGTIDGTVEAYKLG